jgi:serine/threonine protein kinase
MICPECKHENEPDAQLCFSCGFRFLTPSCVVRGTVVGRRYEILSQLGRGGMGVVYRAHDRTLDEDVALKVLRPESGQDEDLRRRFRSEIKLARKVSHRNVCRIHEYGETEALRYISMELIEGSDLRKLFRGRPTSTHEAFDVCHQIALGLEAIHEKGIVHRDLKSPNIMRDAHGVVKLMDFGIAKRLGGEAASRATMTGFIVGTPEYMSPEQAKGEKVDVRADVYSLGAVIFEVFTGDVPFRGDTPLSTMLKHVHEPPPLTGPPAARLPRALLPVLKRCLAKKATERFAHGGEVAAALREAWDQVRSGSEQVEEQATADLFSPGEPTPAPSAPASTPAPATPAPRTPAAHTPGRRTPVPLRPATPARLPRSAESPPRAASLPGRLPVRLILAFLAAPLLIGIPLTFGVALWVRYGARRPASPSGEAPSARLLASPSPPPMANQRPSGMATMAAHIPTPEAPRSREPSSAGARRATPPAPRPGVSRKQEVARSRPAVVPQVPTPLATPEPAPAPTPEPTPPPTPEPSATPPPTPAPTPRPMPVGVSVDVAPAVAHGFLHLTIVPGAEVLIDGKSVGSLTSRKIPLSVGVHSVGLVHPEYLPLVRKFRILRGETVRLIVDLSEEAIRKRK